MTKRATALKLVKPTKTASIAIMSTDMPEPTRPVLLESAVFRKDVTRRLRDVQGEIAVLDATEAQSEARFQAEIEALTEKRDTERAAQADRRHDLLLIQEGCVAALRLSATIEETQQ